MTRRKVNTKTEATVLRMSRRRCCICFGLNRDTEQKSGQIAHLDKNPINNDLENLAWMCLNHHDQYDSKTSQTKNITITEVRMYRKELHDAIESVWKQPVTFGQVTVELNERISGRYVKDGEFASAEIEIHYLGDNKVQVQGFALWGKTRVYGPNIGELDFEAEFIDGKIKFFDNLLESVTYRLELEINENKILATEENVVGYFGMNVSFQGTYEKIKQ